MKETAIDHPPEKEALRSARQGLPKSRNADVTRDHILAAATEEFADKGLYGARVEEIAARTATSKHMIYYYFGSKDALYAATLKRAYAEFRKVEGALDYDALAPIEALRVLVGSTFDAHLSRPHVVRILMSENLDRGRHVREIDQGIQRTLVLSTMSGILQRGAAAGVFRSDIDPLQFHMSLSALSFYYVSNAHTFSHVFDHDMADPENIAVRREEIIETMLARCRA